jgi:hypothetical protein
MFWLILVFEIGFLVDAPAHFLIFFQPLSLAVEYIYELTFPSCHEMKRGKKVGSS